MTPIITVAATLWCLMGLMLITQWMPAIKRVPIGLAIFIFFFILLMGPALVINDIVMNFLDMCLPEGWNTSDQGGGKAA